MIIKLKDLKKISKEKTVFAGGVFDLLHYGHIYYLSKIKELFPDHKLIVGIVPNARVRFTKGPCRPVIGQSERAKIVDSLKFVDYVIITPVINGGETSATEKFISQLKPNIAVFSVKAFLDYQEIFSRFGTKIYILSRSKPHHNSTTKIVRKVQNALNKIG